VVYELPFGKTLHGPLGKALAGWQVSGIVSSFSGPPLAGNATVNNTFALGCGQRPNWSGVSPALDDRSVDRWFNTSVFTNAAPFTFGNASRTYTGLRGDGVRNLDFCLHKTTRIAEKTQPPIPRRIFQPAEPSAIRSSECQPGGGAIRNSNGAGEPASDCAAGSESYVLSACAEVSRPAPQPE